MSERRRGEVLRLLVERGGATGLELIAASGGDLSRAQIYVDLNALAEEGLVVSRLVPSQYGGEVRMFEPTEQGRRKLGQP